MTLTGVSPASLLQPAATFNTQTVAVTGTNVYAITSGAFAYQCVYQIAGTATVVGVGDGARGSATRVTCTLPTVAVTNMTGLGPVLTVTVQLRGPAWNVTLGTAQLGALQAYNCSAIRTWFAGGHVHV
jgi:hypothetical protein